MGIIQFDMVIKKPASLITDQVKFLQKIPENSGKQQKSCHELY